MEIPFSVQIGPGPFFASHQLGCHMELTGRAEENSSRSVWQSDYPPSPGGDFSSHFIFLSTSQGGAVVCSFEGMMIFGVILSATEAMNPLNFRILL